MTGTDGEDPSAAATPRGQRDVPGRPRFAGPATFALLPRLDEVERAHVVVVVLPFDAGTSIRPGARFGHNRIRESSRQLHPYHQTHQVELFERLQVVDAGAVGLTSHHTARAVQQV